MLPVWILILPLLLSSSANESFDPAFKQAEPTVLESYQALLLPDSVLRGQVMLNESCLNLIDVKLQDQTLVRKFERHQVIGGGIAKLLGFRWLQISTEKQKFIGTLRNDLRVPGDPFLSEADLNWDLVPHLRTYIDMVSYGYQVQKEIGRGKKEKDYSVAPYVYPEKGDDLYKYKLHCEHTPAKDYRFMLDALFFPCIRPSGLANHDNFGEEYPSVGMYGPFVSDCNHKCHPELHPYEWIWWLNLNPERKNQDRSKEWLIGMLKEGSNRFPKWSKSPRVGIIKIPFIFEAGSDSLNITVTPLIFNCLSQSSLDKWDEIPETAEQMDFLERAIKLPNGQTLILKNNGPAKLGGWEYWTEIDPSLSSSFQTVGSLCFAIAADELFTAKILQEW